MPLNLKKFCWKVTKEFIVPLSNLFFYNCLFQQFDEFAASVIFQVTKTREEKHQKNDKKEGETL